MEYGRTVQTAFRLRFDLVQKLKNQARIERRSVNSLVEELIQKYLDKEDKYDALCKEFTKRKLSNKTSGEEPQWALDLRQGIEPLTPMELQEDERAKYIMKIDDEDIH